MKLSEIKGARTFDVIAEIIEPIANIAEDSEAAKLFERERIAEGEDPRKVIIKRLKKGLPRLLKTHKADMIAIMAAIEGVAPAKYEAGLNLAKFTVDCSELLTDEAFRALFISAQTGASSGSAPVNTKATE